ncbi:MAG: NAD-dependent deacylase [Candidatus Thermoplasmatota archaeon]|nr:NAD-dependent deacylase [Candidatus Thermoplasmatota archaeon]
MDEEAIARGRELLEQAEHVVGFTGAGVSTASGIPDFRSEGGLWDTFDVREFTFQRFQRDPAGFWELRAELTRALKLDEVAPNPCHVAMAEAVQADAMQAVITQNIDGLHQLAGVPQDKVLEVHGTTRRTRCIKCRATQPIEDALAAVDAGTLPPSCSACGGVVKPDVVLFGEMLPADVLDRARRLARQAEVMLVAGSSLTVHPAAGLPEATLLEGGDLIIVNQDPTPLDGRASVVLRGRVEDAVPRLLSQG